MTTTIASSPVQSARCANAWVEEWFQVAERKGVAHRQEVDMEDFAWGLDYVVRKARTRGIHVIRIRDRILLLAPGPMELL